MLIRSWIAFTGILALALGVMCTLSVLQFGAVQVRLAQDRMAVVAISVAGPFRSVIALGLPISTVRNAEQILARAKAIDPLVADIKVFHQSGIVVHATVNTNRDPISKEIMFDQSVAAEDRWASSQSDRLIAGLTLRGTKGMPIGGILVSTLAAGPEAAVGRTTACRRSFRKRASPGRSSMPGRDAAPGRLRLAGTVARVRRLPPAG